MGWNLDKGKPLCPQICEQMCVQLASGKLSAGERLASVREIAVSSGVNPNTVQKAFEQLEGMGLIYSVRSSGWFVGDNRDAAVKTVDSIIRSKTSAYINEMKALGVSRSKITEIMEGIKDE